jgi:hypothetical protein
MSKNIANSPASVQALKILAWFTDSGGKFLVLLDREVSKAAGQEGCLILVNNALGLIGKITHLHPDWTLAKDKDVRGRSAILSLRLRDDTASVLNQ